ncbi:hypothetical protein [Amphritea sp.]|uniref:hypothetical protein n=1 Tax=Amphritea sp. TaxID=1872502 RepID=UPI003A908CB3
MNRRDFIKIFGAGTAVLAIPDMSFAMDSTNVDSPLLTVFDERFEEGDGLVRTLSGPNKKVISFKHDISTVWFSDILPAFNNGHKIVGVSRPAEYFILEQFLLGEGAAPLYVSAHEYRSHGLLHKVPEGSPLHKLGVEPSFEWGSALAKQLVSEKFFAENQPTIQLISSHKKSLESPDEFFIWRIS